MKMKIAIGMIVLVFTQNQGEENMRVKILEFIEGSEKFWGVDINKKTPSQYYLNDIIEINEIEK